MRYIALIPSYEPTEKLLDILDLLKKSNFEIVLVNDGSKKSYEKIFKDAKKYAKVLEYDENHGKGYALKTGLKYIEKKYQNSIIVTMDSDGQHTIKDAIKLCNITLKKSNTIVLGKRLRDKNVPLKSRLGNSITRKIYKLKTGIDIYDTQTGLRCFNTNLIPFLLSIPGNRFEYEMNMLLNAPKNNIKLEEVTIDTIYENNNKGTHFSIVKDSYLIYKNIINHKKNN